MQVRPAVEADAAAMATLADRPVDVLRDVIHDRSVRVAVTDGDADGVPLRPAAEDAGDGSVATPETDPDDAVLNGFICYDATRDAVHVTALVGGAAACERLLDAPVRFGECEALPVELVAGAEGAAADAATAAGFEDCGDGPRFDGSVTRRFRYDPGGDQPEAAE